MEASHMRTYMAAGPSPRCMPVAPPRHARIARHQSAPSMHDTSENHHHCFASQHRTPRSCRTSAIKKKAAAAPQPEAQPIGGDGSGGALFNLTDSYIPGTYVRKQDVEPDYDDPQWMENVENWSDFWTYQVGGWGQFHRLYLDTFTSDLLMYAGNGAATLKHNILALQPSISCSKDVAAFQNKEPVQPFGIFALAEQSGLWGLAESGQPHRVDVCTILGYRGRIEYITCQTACLYHYVAQNQRILEMQEPSLIAWLHSVL